MRALIKKGVEFSLGNRHLSSLFRHRTSDKKLVVSYHNVVPEGEEAIGAPSLHMAWDRFFKQMDVIREEHRVVRLSDLVSGTAGNGCVAVTFDDAYLGVVDEVLPRLARMEIPATVFVPGRFVGGGTFWWDAIRRPDGTPLGHDGRSHILWNLEGDHDRAREWALDRGYIWREVPAYARCATLESLVRAAALPGIDFESHTWSHPNLATLDEERLREELERSLRWLVSRDMGVGGFIAYPYGLVTPAVGEAARRAGYRGGLLIEGGWIDGSVEDTAIPRLDIPDGISIQGLRLRMRGFLT